MYNPAIIHEEPLTFQAECEEEQDKQVKMSKKAVQKMHNPANKVDLKKVHVTSDVTIDHWHEKQGGWGGAVAPPSLWKGPHPTLLD